MKKVFTLAGLLLLAAGSQAMAQGTELFLSEYDEGAQPSAGGTATPCPNAPNSAGSEKVLEIFNPTTSAVNVNAYSIRRYSNGSLAPSEEERLQPTTGPATLAAGGTYIFANGEATLPTILAAANQLSAPYQTVGPNVITLGGPIFFNGDDAMALVRYPSGTAGMPSPNDGIIVDLFGVIGNDPGTQWSGLDAGGTFVASANQSLRRRADVSGGSTSFNLNTNPGLDPATYNPADQWESYSQAFPPAPALPDPCAQSYADLGTHTYTGPRGTYGALGLLQDFNNSISFYPNPTHGKVNVSLGKNKVGMLTILNGVGKSIVVRPGAAEQTTVDVSTLRPGLYFVRCTSADGQLTVYKELVVQ